MLTLRRKLSLAMLTSQEDTRVSEQARFISMFENEDSKWERSIWENVIILARKGVNNKDDEGFQVFKIRFEKC